MTTVLSSPGRAESEVWPSEVTPDEERVLFLRNKGGGESEARDHERWSLKGVERYGSGVLVVKLAGRETRYPFATGKGFNRHWVARNILKGKVFNRC